MGKPLRAPAPALLVTLALTLPLSACTCRGDHPSGRDAPSASSSSFSSSSVDAAPPAAPSPFVIVGHGPFALRRAPSGPPYAVAGRFAFTLGSRGSLTSLRPLIAEPVINAIGTIGASPEGVTYVEAVMMGEATDAPVTLGLAGAAMYHVANGERFVGFYPWQGGVLALRSELPSSELAISTMPHKARFESLGSKSKPVPKLPAGLLYTDQFAAYADGRVFVLAAERSEDDPIRGGPAFVLDYGASATGLETPKRIALPNVELGHATMSAGNSPAELVVYERGMPPLVPRLVVLDGERFVPVPLTLDASLPLESVSRGDDGSLFVTTGYYGFDGFVRGGLYRITMSGKRANADRIHLPPCDAPATCKELVADYVLALTASDVWLTASAGKNESTLHLLHTQERAPTVFDFDAEALEREAWSEVTPPPWKPSCMSPILVLGSAESLDEPSVLAAFRALRDFPAEQAVRGRLGGERVWAIETFGIEEPRWKTPGAALTAWRQKLPSAKLACAKVLIEKSLSLK